MCVLYYCPSVFEGYSIWVVATGTIPCLVWALGIVTLNYFGWFFPKPHVVSSVHAWISTQVNTYRGDLQIFRYYDILSVCNFSFCYSFLRTPDASVSLEYQFHLLGSGSLQSPPVFFLPPLCSGNSLMKVIGLVCFPSLSDLCLLLPDVSALQVIVSYIFSFLLFQVRG